MSNPAKCVLLCLSALLLSVFTLTAAAEEEVVFGFDNAGELQEWEITEGVSFDPERMRGEEGGSMRVEPGARASLGLRDTDGGGRVDIWFYEDGTRRADPDQRGAGPLAGVVDADGRVLAAGPIFAPYLAGNDSYALGEFSPDEQPWWDVTHLGVGREEGWHRWTFDFDPQEGFRFLHNGEDTGRFSWAESDMEGFAGLVVIGDDAADEDDRQTLWVDRIEVVLEGEMEEVDPLEGIVPPTDPEVEEAPSIVEELMGRHPRLLFGEEDIEELRAFAGSDTAAPMMEEFEGYLPASRSPGEATWLRDATDAQRQGLWRLPTVALHYVLTEDQRSFERTVEFMELLLATPHWELGPEIDSGMGAANIMAGAALAYDWLYHELDPEFREEYRQKLWEHARRMYHAGHLRGHGHTAYWQNDPHNNHRWHRNMGLALCALAAYTGEDDQKWLMKQLAEEIDLVMRWLPEDGSYHEGSSYLTFGGTHLLLGIQAVDRCLGTEYREHPFLQNAADFMTHALTPGLRNRFPFGDHGSVNVGSLGYNTFLYDPIGRFEMPDHLEVWDRIREEHGSGAHVAWTTLLWYPAHLERGSPEALPHRGFFADTGVIYIRDSWAEGGAGAMFKCGPLGGYTLNRFRHANDYQYINVAHDDPDANSFILYADGEFVAETSRYSTRKQTANHNTILINGGGQAAHGRGEGGTWTQPATGNTDMTDMGVITAKAENGGVLAIEGEASGSYLSTSNVPDRPALDRYRRTLIWVEGRYLLVLDDIRAPEPVDVSWLMQGPSLEPEDEAAGRYRLQSGDVSRSFMVVSSEETDPQIVDSPSDHRSEALGWEQLRLEAAGVASVRLASVYDVWDLGDLSVSLEVEDADRATVTVSTDGGEDTWSWRAGEGRFDPSEVVGEDPEGVEIIRMDQPEPATRRLRQEAKDAAP